MTFQRFSLRNTNPTRDCLKSVKWKKKSWSWDKGLEDWTAVMEMNSFPCSAIFQDHLHEKRQGAHLKFRFLVPAQNQRFWFPGTGTQEFLFWTRSGARLMFEGNQFQNVNANLTYLLSCTDWMFQISLSSEYDFRSDISS